eukprot:9244801-Alexandrium_andersonii.AAC.1
MVLPRSAVGRGRKRPQGPRELAIGFATANVLTLDAGAKEGSTDASEVQVVTGRSNVLQVDAARAGLHIAGIQEGRWPHQAEHVAGD